jgi:hypothetical protein
MGYQMHRCEVEIETVDMMLREQCRSHGSIHHHHPLIGPQLTQHQLNQGT